ncbi:putative proteinase inhibitor I13, potato inhibitor I [Medicago truncatula]|uniref:Subtilisin inhibitor 1 n=1 Tax=Medicago truncatula TaxID=3880 RepID=G7IW89_MEDTR|nr:subtilisin inhibitor CLSI-I [Medicago truncatula]AES69032.1 subtilisin inhibitor 1 [Medicago truncatula]RHN65903.1 putative proteinase inhibitor I13, potato inhibitor I [Medicago truncatula]
MAEEKSGQGTNPPQEQPRRNNPTRRNWSELVGVTAEEAERKIKEEMHGVEIRVVPPGYFRFKRVRLYVDQSNKLIKTPTIG